MIALFGQSKNEVALRQDVDQILAKMEQLAITNAEQFQETAEFLQGIKGKQKEVKDNFEPRRAKAEAEKQKVLAEINSYKRPLEKAEIIVKKKLGEYRVAQEQKRREEEQKRLAELKAEAEDQLLNEAETNGDESILDDEIMVAQPVLETAIPQMKGVSFTTVWHFRVVGELDREYLMEDTKKIQGVVDALKANTKIKGIEVYSGVQVGAKAKSA